MHSATIFIAILVFWLAGCQTTTGTPAAGNPTAVGLAQAQTPPLPTLSPVAISLGQEVYAANCATCHGAELEGEVDWKEQNPDGTFRVPPHDASGHTWHHGDETLLEAIRLGGARFADLDIGGTSTMPAYAGTLSDAEIAAVLDYIKSTWPEDIRQMQWEATLREAEMSAGR